MNCNIIGISGKLGSGKTTAAKYLAKHGYTIVNYADILKCSAAAILGVDKSLCYTREGKNTIIPELNITIGAFLQQYGTAMRSIDDDIWVKLLFRNIDTHKEIVIADVRFPNEARAIHERGGKVIRLSAAEPLINNDSRDRNHISETALDNWDLWDMVIHTTRDVKLLYASLDKRILSK